MRPRPHLRRRARSVPSYTKPATRNELHKTKSQTLHCTKQNYTKREGIFVARALKNQNFWLSLAYLTLILLIARPYL